MSEEKELTPEEKLAKWEKEKQPETIRTFPMHNLTNSHREDYISKVGKSKGSRKR